MVTQATFDAVAKELSRKLINKEITSKEMFEGLDEIEKFKAEHGIANLNWRYKQNAKDK